MDEHHPSAGRALMLITLAFLAVSATGCGEEPGSELEVRECLWVYSVAVHGDRFLGREIPVCGSIASGRDGALNLTEGMKPQTRLILRFPASPNGDPGVTRVLATLAASPPGAPLPSLEARYHGRVELRTDTENVFHVTRVDWLDGAPP